MAMRETLGLLRSLIVYRRPGRQAALRQMYAPFVGAGDLVFDVGAHVGDRTRAFASLGARVVALEPQPHVLRWLRRFEEGRAGVTLLPVAAGAEAGVAHLAVSSANPTVSTLAVDWTRRITRSNPTFEGVHWDQTIEVEVTTLDALIATHGIPRFCKIDVEGHEAEVLSGLSTALEGLSVEFVAGTLDVARACVLRLGQLGDYEYNVVRGEGRRFAFAEWQTPKQIADWFVAGAGSASSGDLYARLVSNHEDSQ